MNHDQDDLRPSDAPLDALLNERLGKDKAPDLTHLVKTRHARNEGEAIAKLLDEQSNVVTSGNSRPLLTAAMVLLGSAAVVGTVWSVQGKEAPSNAAGPHDVQPLQQPEQPQPEQLRPEPVDSGTPPKGTQAPQPQGSKPQDPKARQPEGKLAISVKVVDPNGGPVQDFEVEVHYALGKPPRKIGIKAAIPRQKRHPRDFDGDYTVIKGLKPGTYVVTVADKLHAPSQSPVFEVPAGEKPPEVVVKLQQGGTIRGSVIDSSGKPVAGATVKVATREMPPLAPFLKGQLHVEEPSEAKSNPDGSFEIKRLQPGKYRVKVRHDEFSTSRTGEIKVENRDKQTVTVTMKRGATIFGRVTKGGRPQGNWQVRIAELSRGRQFAEILTTLTDKEGNFEFAERLGPGRYRIRTMSGSDNVENPFEQLLQLKHSERNIDIKAGERKLEHNIDLK